MTVSPSHSMTFIDQIPEKDFDPDQRCLLSLETHEELNKGREIVHLKCGKTDLYLNHTDFNEFLKHDLSINCPNCRRHIPHAEVQKHVLNLERIKKITPDEKKEILETHTVRTPRMSAATKTLIMGTALLSSIALLMAADPIDDDSSTFQNCYQSVTITKCDWLHYRNSLL